MLESFAKACESWPGTIRERAWQQFPLESSRRLYKQKAAKSSRKVPLFAMHGCKTENSGLRKVMAKADVIRLECERVFLTKLMCWVTGNRGGRHQNATVRCAECSSSYYRDAVS